VRRPPEIVHVGGLAAAFVTATHNLMTESMRELENIDTERVANPIAYLQLRRRVGGAPWPACLVDYATGAAPAATVPRS
jgi:germacradienol/geosmin synthase